MFGSVQARQKPFQIPLHLGGRRKKFPNPNPKAESSPNHFDSPVISYYFPPFSVSKFPVNLRRAPVRRVEGPNFCVFRPFFLRRRRKLFLSARQGFCSPLGALKIRGGGKRFLWGRPVLLGKNFPLRGAKKGRPAFGTAFRSFSVALSACAPRRRVRPIPRGKPRIRRVREWRRRL